MAPKWNLSEKKIMKPARVIGKVVELRAKF